MTDFFSIDFSAFIAKGGVLVIPILICSVLAFAIFLERLIYYARMRSRGTGLAQTVVHLLEQEKDEEALETATQSCSPMGRILTQALDAKACNRETLETVIVNAT